MGCTNVGKSTLINRLLMQTKGPKHRLITTSAIPGTTLNLISFPIGRYSNSPPPQPLPKTVMPSKGARRKHKRQATLYDTPGVVNDHQMVHHLTPEELRVLLTHQLHSGSLTSLSTPTSLPFQHKRLQCLPKSLSPIYSA